MKLQLSSQINNINADCIVIGMFDKKLTGPDLALHDFVKNTSQLNSAGDCALVPLSGKIKAALIINFGSPKQLNADRYAEYVQAAAKHCHRAHFTRVVYALGDIHVPHSDARQCLYTCAVSLHQAYYAYDVYKTKKAQTRLQEVTFIGPQSLSSTIKEASALIQGMQLTMDLGNCPPNVCTPAYIVKQAQAMASTRTNVSVLNEAALKKMKAGAILAVGQGSPNKPYMVFVDYRGGKKSDQPHVLVGKGISFDTGGNQLKQPLSMVGMKYDMCGAATVLGVMKIVALLKLPINVIGAIATAENIPGGQAYRPEDIITSLSGKTIEVLNTDAEGRLVLCDALTYVEKYKPKSVIDIATLTGAMLIALGDKASGLFSNNDALAEKLENAAEQSRDKVWRMPIWDEYKKQLRSAYADFANIGGPNAGSITAACFLSEFATSYPWAHLDVAGTAAGMFGDARKATGRPVRLLMEYLLQEYQQ